MLHETRDDNALHVAGELPIDPTADAVPMPPDTSARQATLQLVTADTDARRLATPIDHIAEAQLLGMILWAGKHSPGAVTMGMVRDLVDAGKFALSAHQTIATAIVQLEQSGAGVDPVSVHSELVRTSIARTVGGIDYLEKLTSSVGVPTEKSLREHAASIRQMWDRRGLMKLGRFFEERAKKASSSAEALTDARRAFEEYATKVGATSTGTVSLATCTATVIRQVLEERKDGFRTGLETLDDLTGGFFPGEFSILGARTSVGKSAFALQCGIGTVDHNENAAVLFITLEMTGMAFSRRALAAMAGVQTNKLRRGLINQSEYSRLMAAAQQIETKAITFAESQSQTVASIEALARSHAEALARSGKRLALVVIDHVGLVQPDAASQKKNREQQVAETSRACVRMAAELNCAVLGLVQIKREAEGQNGSKMPRLHHLRESGALEQDAHNVLILHRARDASGARFEDEPAVLALAKARDDEPAIVRLGFESAKQRFFDLQYEERSVEVAP